jgi:hypothetical protein
MHDKIILNLIIFVMLIWKLENDYHAHHPIKCFPIYYINCVVCAFVRLSVEVPILDLDRWSQFWTSTDGPNFGF